MTSCQYMHVSYTKEILVYCNHLLQLVLLQLTMRKCQNKSFRCRPKVLGYQKEFTNHNQEPSVCNHNDLFMQSLVMSCKVQVTTNGWSGQVFSSF